MCNLLKKTVACLRNNNNKPIDIYHDQDGHNLVESPWKYFVFWQNNNKLLGLQALSVHTIEDVRSKFKMTIICWEMDLYWE